MKWYKIYTKLTVSSIGRTRKPKLI